jgi:hypothetical protein
MDARIWEILCKITPEMAQYLIHLIASTKHGSEVNEEGSEEGPERDSS